MKLTFPGTRGYIEARTRLHNMHSSCRVSYKGAEATIDCGQDWLGKLDILKPEVLLITHAHPDHADGLKNGAPCPVFATPETWEVIEDYQVEDRRLIRPGRPVTIEGIVFEAFELAHSTRAPAVGFRISAGRAVAFYVPDVVYIKERTKALQGVKLYVGDGATVSRSMVRKPGEALIGHTPVRTQLTWCQKERVPRAIFTHCGSDIVERDRKEVLAEVQGFAKERGLQAGVACDGMEVVIR